MKVAFTGGRDYKNKDLVVNLLNNLNKDNTPRIFYGDCPTGLDSFIKYYLMYNSSDILVKSTEFKADWTKYGKAAGPKRNRAMLEAMGNTGILIAFSGNKGTQNTIDTAHELGIPVLRVEDPNERNGLIKKAVKPKKNISSNNYDEQW